MSVAGFFRSKGIHQLKGVFHLKGLRHHAGDVVRGRFFDLGLIHFGLGCFWSDESGIGICLLGKGWREREHPCCEEGDEREEAEELAVHEAIITAKAFPEQVCRTRVPSDFQRTLPFLQR